MKKISLILILLTSLNVCGQTKSIDDKKIKKTITSFLEWYKIKNADTSKPEYSITKGGYPDSTTQRLIDFDGVEKYLVDINQKKLLSEIYLNNIRKHYYEANEILKLRPPSIDLTATPGLNIDVILSTFEPEEILNNLKKGKFNKVEIIYNKAIARFKISKEIQLLFTLTKVNNKWLIDYIGYDNSYKYSFGKQ